MSLNIANFQFILQKDRRTTEVLPGKTPYYVCCERTLACLQGLVPFDPSERDFALFEKVFSNPHDLMSRLSLPQLIEREEVLEYFFQQVATGVGELTRSDLIEYFFECVNVEINWKIHKNLTGKWRFPILKFSERLEVIKQAAIEGPTTPIVDTENEYINHEFTTARQVLSILYLLEYCQVKGVDQMAKARFIEFLTNKNFKNIYDQVRNPLATKQGNFRRADLQFIRPFFENLGLIEVVKMINNELDKPDS